MGVPAYCLAVDGLSGDTEPLEEFLPDAILRRATE